MKTTSRVFTAMLATGLFLTAFTFAQAQSSASWTTSKGVQKVANKQMFNDEDLQKSHIQATSVSSIWNISKGVQTIGDNNNVTEANVISNNDASWVISKGVHQMNNTTVVAKTNTPSKDLTTKGEQQVDRK